MLEKMFTKGDKVRFRDDLVREKRFPPYQLTVIDTYETDDGCFCLRDAYDLEDTITGEKYMGISHKCLVLVKKHEPKADSEKISKNKKARFRIRKSMFAGFWFISCPIVLLAFILTQSYWVFTAMLIPLAVGIFGADD